MTDVERNKLAIHEKEKGNEVRFLKYWYHSICVNVDVDKFFLKRRTFLTNQPRTHKCVQSPIRIDISRH